MEFDYYHLQSGEEFNQYFKFVRQVAMEDFELCEKAQANLEKGIYVEGILNPEKETGVACECLSESKNLWTRQLIPVSVYQQRVLNLVCNQHALENTIKPGIHEGEIHVVHSTLVDPTSS